MTGFLEIDGLDAYSTYGIVVLPGNYGRLLRLPEVKDNGLTENFVNEDGDDEYLIDPKFEAINITLPFAIHATDEAQFFARYKAFRAVMLSGGEKNWDFMQLDGGTRFKLSYRSMSDYDFLTTITNTNNIGANFTLNLKNNHPVTLIPIP